MYRTVNAERSGNLRWSAVMRSLCAIMDGTIIVRTSSPHRALTVTGGPHWRWRSRSRIICACRASSRCFKASAAAISSLDLFSPFFAGARPRPPRPCTCFLGSRSAANALASSLEASHAIAAAESAFAFFV